LKTQNDESPAKEVSAIHPQKPQGTILVVEDDVNVLEFVKIVLQQAGYHVRVTPDSREALTWIEQTAAKTESDLQRADAVLVDYTLPHMSGMELCERIRHLCPELPLLLMSGYTREEVADAMEQLRKIVFLQKPFKPAELLAALETCTQIHP
ncbi:MAG TPA: response regulator, partial [Gemmatales bacterium]|nr:response regulator [Gemmatales bacterium]